MLLLAFLCMPIIFLPLAIYQGIQANVKGGKGQGTMTLVVAGIILFIQVMFVATYLLDAARFPHSLKFMEESVASVFERLF